jgi:hypothetical protein
MRDAALNRSYADQRTTKRHTVTLRSVLVESSTIGELVDILNIARLGFLARSRLHRKTGQDLRLHLPSFEPIEASVVWCDKGLLGGRFREPIEEAEFERFLIEIGAS